MVGSISYHIAPPSLSRYAKTMSSLGSLREPTLTGGRNIHPNPCHITKTMLYSLVVRCYTSVVFDEETGLC